jgi:hypothetical protein
MQEGEIERTVTVLGKPCTVSVYQSSKSVWVCIGSYNGERIEAKGRSMSSAVRSWIKAATYKGNLKLRLNMM